MLCGTCGCSKCGLRGHSKNVRTRNVFPIFRLRPIMLESYEWHIKAQQDVKNPGTYFFGSDAKDWTKDGAPTYSLADTLINYLKTPDASIEDLRILLCVHNWVQDEGTETT